jgi:predicted membrane protein
MSDQVIEIIGKGLLISFLSGIGIYFITALWDSFTDILIPLWIIDFAMTLVAVVIGFIILIIKN